MTSFMKSTFKAAANWLLVIVLGVSLSGCVTTRVPTAATSPWQAIDLDTIFMGFGLDDDRVHSPTEKFELDCSRLGAKSHAVLIDELHKMKP